MGVGLYRPHQVMLAGVKLVEVVARTVDGVSSGVRGVWRSAIRWPCYISWIQKRR